MITEDQFREMCKAHDLTYAYSDDHRVWQRGEAQHKAIMEAAKQLPREVAQRIWNEQVDLKLVEDAREGWHWK